MIFNEDYMYKDQVQEKNREAKVKDLMKFDELKDEVI